MYLKRLDRPLSELDHLAAAIISHGEKHELAYLAACTLKRRNNSELVIDWTIIRKSVHMILRLSELINIGIAYHLCGEKLNIALALDMMEFAFEALTGWTAPLVPVLVELGYWAWVVNCVWFRLKRGLVDRLLRLKYTLLRRRFEEGLGGRVRLQARIAGKRRGGIERLSDAA